MHEIIYQPKAMRQLRKIANHVEIMSKIENLVNMPNCTNIKSLTNHIYDYRLRVGNYRVFFNFNGFINVVSIEEVKKRDDNTY